MIIDFFSIILSLFNWIMNGFSLLFFPNFMVGFIIWFIILNQIKTLMICFKTMLYDWKINNFFKSYIWTKSYINLLNHKEKDIDWKCHKVVNSGLLLWWSLNNLYKEGQAFLNSTIIKTNQLFSSQYTINTIKPWYYVKMRMLENCFFFFFFCWVNLH